MFYIQHYQHVEYTKNTISMYNIRALCHHMKRTAYLMKGIGEDYQHVE